MIPRSTTLDTNVLPIDDLRSLAARFCIDLAITTVTDTEIGADDPRARDLLRLSEPLVLGESPLGVGVMAPEERGQRFDRILAIISNESFPRRGYRSNLTDGQRRQLRDAIAFEAHIASGRDAFVTKDEKAFVNEGRRAKLQTLGQTQVLTRAEFMTLLSS